MISGCLKDVLIIHNDLTGKILKKWSLTRDVHTCLRFNLRVLYKAKTLGYRNMQFDNWIYGKCTKFRPKIILMGYHYYLVLLSVNLKDYQNDLTVFFY